MQDIARNKEQQAVLPRYEKAGLASPVLEILDNPGCPTVLFYPGSMLEPGHYAALLRAIHARGFAVCGLHLAGHGRCREIRGFTFQTLVNEGLTAAAWLAKHDLGPVVVAGHSQGAILTLAHAASCPHTAAAFAVSAAYPQLPSAIQLTRFARLHRHRDKISRFIDKLARRFPGLPVPLPLYLSLGKIRSGMLKPLEKGNGKMRMAYPLEYLNSLFQASIPTRALCPVWLISSITDALFTRAIVQETFAALRAPRKELIWLAEGGHTAALNPGLAWQISGIVKSGCRALGLAQAQNRSCHAEQGQLCQQGD